MISYKELAKFIGQFIHIQRWKFLSILIISAILPFDALLWPFFLHLIIDIFTKFEANRAAAWQALQWPIAGMVLLTLGIEIGNRLISFLTAKTIPKFEADIRSTMFDHIQRHSPKYFNERFAGGLTNRITDMTTHTTAIIQEIIWTLIPAIITCIAGSIFLWIVNPLFTWIMIAWIVLHISVCTKFIHSCDKYEHQRGEARTALIGTIVDSLTNNFVVNLFYHFDFEKNYLEHFQKKEQISHELAKINVEKLRFLLSGIYLIGISFGLNGFLIYLWLHHRISTGQVVQIFTTGWNFSMLFWQVGAELPEIFQSAGMIKQAYSLMRDPSDIKDKPGAEKLKVFKGEIIFDDVYFHYNESKLFSFNHVHIKEGEKIGLVGFSGAGKTTFINLILRFYPLDKGKILIDGQDIAKVTLRSLRKQIALIPQDPILFHRSLYENIRYGNPETTPQEVFRAAQLAHCDQFIRRLPNGYETKAGERGAKLSGGEKQRIAIARAILTDAPILILDEATSALDSITERYIQESFAQLMENRTTLVIAHRLATLAQMDRIFVFDQGRIVEKGSHSELMDKSKVYAKMWKMQVDGHLPEELVS